MESGADGTDVDGRDGGGGKNDNDNGDGDGNKDKGRPSTPTTTTVGTTSTTTTAAPVPVAPTPTTSGSRNIGILRVDTAGARRVVQQPPEPSSPQPSVDRLSVSFALGHSDYSYDGKSLGSDRSDTELQQTRQQQGQPQEAVGIPSHLNAGGVAGTGEGASSTATARGRGGSKSNLFSMAESEAGAGGAAGAGAGEGRGSAAGQHLSAGLTDEDDDYSASISAILHRRASTRKVKGLGRRTSSPLDSDNRRCSVFTTSSGETAITVDGFGEGPVTQEQIFENIRLHKEVLESVKNQPWEMRRKLKLVQQAKEYVRLHEGQLQERLAQSKSTRDIMARFNIVMSRWWQHMKRKAGNMAVIMTPWELRIKEIESHFGSVVASYFTFLRWIFWINIVITAIIICLVIVPEVLAADPSLAGDRKILLDSEKRTGSHLETIWNFEGVMKHSPLFYGYYSDQPKTKEGYPLPLSYFLTGLGVYAYSFVAILRRMAKNSKQSKLSEKEDECTFSWKLFTGWDYMIGNPETAFNRFASITMGFKEALLEEKEKTKEGRNWKIIGLRVLANFLVLLLLASSAFAVIFVVGRSEQLEMSGEGQSASWWRKNEITLVLSLITTVFPNIFEIIGMLEGYHPRKQLRFQLARIMVLNFLNLYTLIIALFGQVQTMTAELERMRPTTTMPGPTFAPDYNYCVNVSVNCTVLQEFEFYQKEKHAKDVLTLFVKSVIYSKYEPDLIGIPGNKSSGNKSSSVSTSLSSTAADVIPLILKQSQSGNGTKPDDYATLLAKAVVELMYSATPQMGTISEDLRQYFSDVNDHENLTLKSPFVNAERATNLIPENATVLKTSLPILFEIIHKYIPLDRLFKVHDKLVTTEAYDNVTDTTELLSCNVTSMCSDDEGSTSSSTGSSLSSSSTTMETEMESTTTPSMSMSTPSTTVEPLLPQRGAGNGARTAGSTSTPRRRRPEQSTSVPAFTATTTPTTTSRLSYRRRRKTTTTPAPQTVPAYYRADSIWGRRRNQRSKPLTYTVTNYGTGTTLEDENEDTEVTEADDSRYNLQLTGENSYQSIPSKSSTRGDIPGDLSQSEDDLTSTTTSLPSTTDLLVLPDDFTEKLLTTIVTMIQIISTQNSSRTDYSNLTTVDQFVELVAKFHTHSETILTNDPYNNSLSATFDRQTIVNETNRCYIMACENGTTLPPDIYEYLNCNDSDIACAMNALLISEPTRPPSAARGSGNGTAMILTTPSPPPGCIIPGSRSCFTTEPPVTLDPDVSIKLRRLCWETMFGQELVKLTVMDLIFTVGFIIALDFIRAILVRVLNPCWCWDLEKKFPQYGDFKIAENILHLVNNQGMVWMGMFFSPGLPALNLVKLVILMYIRSWAVMTCNVPHETVFRASRSNNFYFALLLFMLFLCTLPVGFAIVWLKPSWHCGPFSHKYDRIYYIFTKHLKELVPVTLHGVLEYIASPAVIIPLLVLLVLIIYYLTSLTNSLRESNNDLKIQLRRERTEERRKMFKIAGGKGKEKDSPFTRWKSLIPSLAPETFKAVKKESILTTGKQTGFAGLAKRATLKAREVQQQQQSDPASLQDDGNGTDIDQASLPEDIVALPQSSMLQKKRHPSVTRKPSCTDSVASIRSEIPVIKIEDTNKGDDKKQAAATPAPAPTHATTTAGTASSVTITTPTAASTPTIVPSTTAAGAGSGTTASTVTPILKSPSSVRKPPPPPSPKVVRTSAAPTTPVKVAQTLAGPSQQPTPIAGASAAGAAKPSERGPPPPVPPPKKQRLLKALLSKAKDTKKIRSQPEEEPIVLVLEKDKQEDAQVAEGGGAISKGKVKFFNTAESLEERQLLSAATAQSVDSDDVSYLKMEAEQTDVHPFFIKIQTSVEKQE